MTTRISSIIKALFAYNSFDMYIFFLFIINTNAQDSAQYLETVIESLRHVNNYPSQRKMDHIRVAKSPITLPTYSPSKEDLAQLYGAALKKGDTVKIHSDHGPTVDAAVYELDEKDEKTDSNDDSSSYYFYYYPLKAFIDELTSDKAHHDEQEEHHDVQTSETFPHHEILPAKPTHHQYHTHLHEHNVHIMEKKPSHHYKKPLKALQPLFMAISGFIGMTIMFVLSALLLPKIGVLKPRDVKDAPEMTSVAKIIFQAIEGYDCSERISCEVGKTARAFNIHNNRFVKLIRRIGPASLSKRLYDINKYSNKKYKCALIQCKMKTKILQPKKSAKLSKN